METKVINQINCEKRFTIQKNEQGKCSIEREKLNKNKKGTIRHQDSHRGGSKEPHPLP